MTLVRSVLKHDDLVLRDLDEEDCALLNELDCLDSNRGILRPDIPPARMGEFLDALRRQIWAEPMTCERKGEPVGILLNIGTDVGSLNTRLAVLLREPVRDRLALALYTRHLFWSYPLRRVFAEVPNYADDYCSMFQWGGFDTEGELTDHLMVAGKYYSMKVFGLLRPNFEDWTRREYPRLSLGSGR